MIRTMICLTTALAFALHMGLGCCSHHAHADDDHACPHHHAAAGHHSHELAAHGHSHAHHEHATSEKSHETPTPDSCPHDTCQGGKCVFVSISKVNLPQLANVCLPSITQNESPGVFSTSALVQICDSGGPLKLPLRLHLFQQVLLI